MPPVRINALGRQITIKAVRTGRSPKTGRSANPAIPNVEPTNIPITAGQDAVPGTPGEPDSTGHGEREERKAPMFDFKSAKWQRDKLNLTDHVSIKLWKSQPSADTYQVFLYWQDEPGQARTLVYKRYFKSSCMESAKASAGPIIRRWAAKQPVKPDSVTDAQWDEILSLLGVLPRPRPIHNADECDKEEKPMKIKIFVSEGEVKAIMADGGPVDIGVVYGTGSSLERDAWDKAVRSCENMGLTERTFRSDAIQW